MNTPTSLITKLTKLIEENKTYIIDGSLNRNQIAADARKYDPDLLNLLQKDTELKEHFFAATDGGLVFKKDVFLQFIMNKEFLPDSYTKYKIKIGLGAEDGSLFSESGDVVLNWPYKDTILEGGQDKEDQKRSEVFFNEVLAPDQITRLLDDKVFTNWKRYDKVGEHDLDELNHDDNLIIKGNNLVVLRSLQKRFAGKVKLIYIDPPFNTEHDTFHYNDRFTQSTWLTFMRNRLHVAKELLAEGGSIYVHLDFNQSHYAKVLMDEIFGVANFRNEIIWAYGAGGSPKDFFPRKHDSILFYVRGNGNTFNKDPKIMHVPYDQSTLDMHFKKVDENGRRYRSQKVNGREYITYEDEGKLVTDVWTDIGAQNATSPISSEATGFSTQKPEKLMQRIIAASTNEGDIVLDYHLGSGTTAAVAHKMKRRYIGIEQLYYGELDPVNRIKKVISGDNAGISKEVDWNGGGSFVYANIMNNSNKFRKLVEAARNDTDYLHLLKEATSSSFLSYRVDPKKINEEEFRKLSFAEKRRLLLELIDNNTLYVNYEDINDPIFKVSERDKEFNKKLYESETQGRS